MIFLQQQINNGCFLGRLRRIWQQFRPYKQQWSGLEQGLSDLGSLEANEEPAPDQSPAGDKGTHEMDSWQPICAFCQPSWRVSCGQLPIWRQQRFNPQLDSRQWCIQRFGSHLFQQPRQHVSRGWTLWPRQLPSRNHQWSCLVSIKVSRMTCFQ